MKTRKVNQTRLQPRPIALAKERNTLCVPPYNGVPTLITGWLGLFYPDIIPWCNKDLRVNLDYTPL